MTELTEKQSSIELSRNAKGEYAWKIKRYYNEDTQNEEELVDYVEDLNTKLKLRFTGGK